MKKKKSNGIVIIKIKMSRNSLKDMKENKYEKEKIIKLKDNLSGICEFEPKIFWDYEFSMNEGNYLLLVYLNLALNSNEDR